jgi:hypothetical protein
MKLYNITNHPEDSSIARKAGRSGIKTDEHRPSDQKYVYLEILVKHYQTEIISGETIYNEYNLIPDYIFTLKATNDTLVDPATGEYVDSSFQGAMGEAEYFINVIAANNISIDDLTDSMILRADSYNRFNNYVGQTIVTWM